MTPRTRAATNNTDTTPAPAAAKKTAAKKPPAKPRPARTRSPRKPAATTLSLVKPTAVRPAEGRPTVIDHRQPLTVRRRLFVGPMGATEQAAVRAALASAAARLPIPVRAWNGSQATLTDGTLLIHNPSPDRQFTAHIACPHGAIHGYPIQTARDLGAARAITNACGRKHAPNTPGDDGIEFNWDKATAHGIRPTTRLAEGLVVAKKAAADTQPLSRNDITAGLAQRTADTEAPKEHPGHA